MECRRPPWHGRWWNDGWRWLRHPDHCRYYILPGWRSSAILNSGGSATPVRTEQRQPASEQDKQLYELVSMLDAWNTKTWTQIFQENGMKYVAPKIIMFSNSTNSGCGPAQSAMGPFYCPADQSVYVDMSFFNELQSRYGAKVSEFTVAYVLGHEIGHHVQTLLGTTQKVDQLRRSGRYSEAEMNRVSVAVELQADFMLVYGLKRTTNVFREESWSLEILNLQ